MAYIGLELAKHSAAQLCGIPGAQLHLTLAHFPKPTPDKSVEIAEWLGLIATGLPPLELQTMSVEAWGMSWGAGEVYRVFRTPALVELRAEVLVRLGRSGISPSDGFEFNPHITVLRRGPVNVGAPVQVAGLELAGTVGIVRYSFPLRGMHASDF